MQQQQYSWRRRLIGLALIALISGCQSGGDGKEAPKGGARGGDKGPPLVEVAQPGRPDTGRVREYMGTVESRNQVSIVPQIAGQLTQVNASVGDRVTQGQVLAVVVDPENDAQLGQAQATVAMAQSAVQNANANARAAEETVNSRTQAIAQAEASIAEAHASIAKAKSDLLLAETTLKRTQELAARELIAQQDLDRAIADASAAAADLALAEARLSSATSQRTQAQLNVATAREQQLAAQAQIGSAQAQAQSLAEAARAVSVRTGLSQVRSPINGTVVSRSLDPGAYVSPGAQSVIMVLANPDDLRVAFDLSEADMELVQTGQNVTVTFDALPGQPQEGVVLGLAGGLDTASRTVRVEVKLPTGTDKILPGMLGRLTVGNPADNLLQVPLPAVVSDKGEKFVYVLGAEKKVEKKTVVVAALKGDSALISSGLKPEDQVVVQGVNLVRVGQPVRTEADSDNAAREKP